MQLARIRTTPREIRGPTVTRKIRFSFDGAVDAFFRPRPREKTSFSQIFLVPITISARSVRTRAIPRTIRIPTVA